MHKTSEGTIRSLILHFSRTVETCTNNSETPAAIMATYLMSASRQHSGTENVISCLEELLNHPNGEFTSQVNKAVSRNEIGREDGVMAEKVKGQTKTG